MVYGLSQSYATQLSSLNAPNPFKLCYASAATGFMITTGKTKITSDWSAAALYLTPEQTKLLLQPTMFVALVSLTVNTLQK